VGGTNQIANCKLRLGLGINNTKNCQNFRLAAKNDSNEAAFSGFFLLKWQFLALA